MDTDNNDLPTSRHSVSLLHAHLVFVTKYRRPVFTDAMLTFTEHTTRSVGAELDVELVEFNGETDHVHLLVAYPLTLAISVLVQRLKGRTAYALRRGSLASASAPACAATSGRRPPSPSPAVVHHCRSSSNTSTAKADHSDHRAPPSHKTGSAHPGLKSEACAQNPVNIYTAQRQNGCETDPRLDGRLVEAARLHTLDVLNNPNLNGDIGSDGSTPQDRANATGFVGKVAETVAINPALAISGIEILGQWWYDPPSRATMQDCSNTAIGVWSENSLARSVVVAVYGQPSL